MISIIAAMDKKRGIGKDGSIPWNIPEDFRHFKEITTGHPIIMGRRTFESLGRILPERTHIVITHDLENKTTVEGLIWTDSLDSAIELARKQKGNEEVFIIGGGEIYKQAIEHDHVEKMYLTIIDGDFEADTFFPEYSGFKEEKKEEKESGKYKYSFKNYIKTIL